MHLNIWPVCLPPLQRFNIHTLVTHPRTLSWTPCPAQFCLSFKATHHCLPPSPPFHPGHTIPFPQVLRYLRIILPLAALPPTSFSTQWPSDLYKHLQSQDPHPHHTQGGPAKFKAGRVPLQPHHQHLLASPQPKSSFQKESAFRVSVLLSGKHLFSAPAAPLHKGAISHASTPLRSHRLHLADGEDGCLTHSHRVSAPKTGGHRSNLPACHPPSGQ